MNAFAGGKVYYVYDPLKSLHQFIKLSLISLNCRKVLNFIPTEDQATDKDLSLVRNDSKIERALGVH